MELTVPSWFKQRQAKAEAAGPELFRLTAPNLAEAFIAIRKAENGKWSASLRLKADGPNLATTEPTFTHPTEAWEAAFELYRANIVA